MITKKSLKLIETSPDQSEQLATNEPVITELASNEPVTNELEKTELQAPIELPTTTEQPTPPDSGNFKIFKSEKGFKTFKRKTTANINIIENENTPAPVEGDLNNEITNYLKKIDIKTTADINQLENIIEQLETYKYKQNNIMNEYNKTNKIKEYASCKEVYNKIMYVLAEIKGINNRINVATNLKQKAQLVEEFKKKYKKMSDENFKKQINLMAPKSDRTPDPGTILWDNSKKNQFMNELRKKKIELSDEYKDKIESNKQGNYKKLSTILYNPDELKCTKYDLIKHIQNNKIY